MILRESMSTTATSLTGTQSSAVLSRSPSTVTTSVLDAYDPDQRSNDYPSRPPSPLLHIHEGLELSTRSSSPLRLSASVFTDAKKHGRFFFDDGTVTMMVEKTLFRVHRFFFQRDSALFREQLLVHPKVRSGESVVELKDCTALDLERFLDVLYPNDFNRRTTATLEEWTSILALASHWGFESLRRLAVGNVFPLASPIDKVILGHKYDIEDWLADSYLHICLRPDPISDVEAEQLGAKDVARVSRVRERIWREHLLTSDLNAMRKLVEKEFQVLREATREDDSVEDRPPQEHAGDAVAQEETSRGDESQQGGSVVARGIEDSVPDTGPNPINSKAVPSDSHTGHPSESTSEVVPVDEPGSRASTHEEEDPVRVSRDPVNLHLSSQAPWHNGSHDGNGEAGAMRQDEMTTALVTIRDRKGKIARRGRKERRRRLKTGRTRGKEYLR
ncbi:hypothetical protein OE88DRAFT_333091 [Heliocybe sulcata]|uniref:BTB domain-containing protein n=1 Tax=Heliocybe sulcata TaxID=5364 RepID=A0A5C3MY08_9AGAM|nr:hypothetical protein OE88DRAFT_333091 [Heliocybe sulcata]